ncbi:MAG: hypothetical protein ACR2RE_13195 [Geminicoccaceae bacterium]
MSNGEAASLGTAVAHSECKIVPYDNLEDVTMDCWLEQGGERVTQFYDPTKNGTFKARVCLVGNLRYHLCAELCMCVHIECVGPGDPKELPCLRIPLDPCKDPDGVDGENKACYDFELTIPSNHLSARECGSFCCFVATLSSFTQCDNPADQRPGHICCYCKGPCVMVCNPPVHRIR